MGAQPRERADGGADLREDVEVAETFGIDAEAAAALVVAEALFEVGEALERVAHEDPREVVVEVAPVRELPVGDRDELGPRVHEVAGTGVALHQHERPVAVGGAVVPQPRERQRDHGNAAAGVRVLGLPLDDLVEHVLADRPRRTELGQVESLGIETVEQGQLLHELLCHRQLLGRVGDLGEAARTLHAAHQERGLGGVHRHQRGDAHRGGAQRPVHRRFPRE